MSCWKSVLELDSKEAVIAGSEKALCEAIDNAADFLRPTGAMPQYILIQPQNKTISLS